MAWEPKEHQILSNHGVYFTALDLTPQDGSGPYSVELLKAHFRTWEVRETYRQTKKLRAPIMWVEKEDHPMGDTELTSERHPHLSVKNWGQIAFTDTDTNGNRDVQKCLPVGRYLTKFYPDMPETEKKRLVDEWNAYYDRSSRLSFTDDPDEIARIYTHGPSSCMSHDGENFSNTWDDHHPTEAYGAPGDLSLAYLGLPSRATARAIVDQKKKYWVRAYGQIERISGILKLAGYTDKSQYDDGTKLNLILNSDGSKAICPYIDGGSRRVRVDRENNFLILGSTGITADTTSGAITIPRPVRCNCCKTLITVEEHDTYLIIRGNYVCNSCVESQFDYCDFEGEWYSKGSREFVTYIDKYGHRGRAQKSWITSKRNFVQDSISLITGGDPVYVDRSVLVNINPHGTPINVFILNAEQYKTQYAHLIIGAPDAVAA